jgi:hypothetical protein
MADLNTILQNIQSYLNTGSFDVDCNTCCPECGDIYVFASVERFLTFAEAQTSGPEPVFSETPCCYERCITELYDYVGSAENIEAILAAGIVEYSTIQGKSFVCLLLDFATENNLTGDELAQLIVYILDLGVVVSCINGNTVVASISTWVTWADAMDVPTITSEDACCLTTTANVQTYLQLAEALGWSAFVPPV